MDILNRASLVFRLPIGIQEALNDTQIQIRRKAGADLVRWTPVNELALTLVTLGEISPLQIAQIGTAVNSIAPQFVPIDIVLAGLGGSPTNLQPRFLWIGLGGDVEALTQLNAHLERTVSPFLPGHEVRPFPAYLPIGRLKQESESNRSALGRAIRVAAIGEIGRFHAGSLELVRMAGTSAGPTMITVQSYPLG